jgi:hypothetical protein
VCLICDYRLDDAKQETLRILWRQAANVVIETRCVKDSLTVSGRDEDVPMRTGWEKLGEVKVDIVCVIEQEEPILAFPSEPSKGIICSFAYPFRKSDILQVGINSLSCGGVDEKDLRETVWARIFSLKVP